MYSTLAKIRRPLLVSALILGMGMGVASAYDFCNPCRPKPKPVVVRTNCNPCVSNPCASVGSSYTTTSSVSYAAPAYVAPAPVYNTPAMATTTRMPVVLNPGEEVPYVPGL